MICYLRYISPYFYLLFVGFLIIFNAISSEEIEKIYAGPQEVATTEGLPSSLVNRAVCAITGEYVDTVQDLVIPGPEPLTISRTYTSFSKDGQWFFNEYGWLAFNTALYQGDPSFVISLRQPSGSKLDYVFPKKKANEKIKRVHFKFVTPKGLTNGASMLSGKTNPPNQTLSYNWEKRRVTVQGGTGNKRIFKESNRRTSDGRHIYAQLSEEKVNGSRIRYEGEPKGIGAAEEIICENSLTSKVYSSVKFKESDLGNHKFLQKITTSDGRELSYYFDHHHYKLMGGNNSHQIDRYYLSKVAHPYACPISYTLPRKKLEPR